MTDRPARAERPIFASEPPVPVAPAHLAARRVAAPAFAAVLLGNAMLAIGPWFVRLADVGPVASGFWRLAIACPLLLAIGARAHARAHERGGGGRIGRDLILLTTVAGLFFAFDLATWHAGILRTRLANATLFGNVTSFFFVAYGFVVARAWPGRVQAVALLLALAGVALLMGRSFELSPEHVVGDLLCVLAALFYTGYLIAIDRVRGRLGTWPTLAAATLAATVVLLPLALIVGGAIVPRNWTPLIALAIGSQVIGQGLLVYSIGTLPATLVGVALLTQPVVAATIGWLAYDERLGLADLVGAAAIAAALVLIRRGD